MTSECITKPIGETDVKCRRLRTDVLAIIKKAAYERGIIPSIEGSDSDSIRWAATQFARQISQASDESAS